MQDRHELVRRLIDIPSVSGTEREILLALEAELVERGFTCHRQEVAPERWNLLATRTPAPSLLYSTHVDTVPPHLPAAIGPDRISGRGACDTKGGIVAMLEAGDRLAATGRDGFGYLFVVGEEVDHVGARVASGLDVRPRRIILCEPTANRVVAAQKGMVKLVLTGTGRAGHSAYPDRGHSAVHDLLDAIGDLREHAWPRDGELGPTTLNVGVIGGGVAANVFAPEARAEMMIRAVSPVEELMATIRKLVGERARITVPAANDPVRFDPPPGVETCVVAFNTDATYLGELGPVWLVGPGEIEHAHAADEHITFASLAAGVDLYEHLGRLALEGADT